MTFPNHLFLLSFCIFLSTLLLIFASPHQIFTQKNIIKNEEIVERSMFPHDFYFGVTTSAYQVEGAYLEDGKGLSNWDVFSHVPGNVANQDNGDVADDYYHRYREDIKIVKDLGVNAYRFSISWARILPKGRFGEVNQKGVDFYNNIINDLLFKGIEPFVTIQHFDHPQELEERYGGWLSPLMQEDYVHYAKICFEEFGDRVKHWVTINEPNILAESSYVLGIFPPGRCSPPFGKCSHGNSDVESLIAVHNMLLSHAKAVQLYRQQFKPKHQGYIGMVVYAACYVPYRDDNFSREAVERAFANDIAWVLDPVIYGRYPPEMRKYHGKELPEFTDDETELLKGSVDFIGINHYTTLYAVDCLHYSSECTSKNNRPIRGFVKTTGIRDDILIGEPAGKKSRFFIVPQGMELIMDYIRIRYPNITIYVTENGYSPPSASNVPDMLQDFKRVDFFQTYIAALARAMRKGAKVKGYFAWSLLDNFEWADGYSPTYGLYYVDRNTLERIPKLSATWYTKFLANRDPIEYRSQIQ
ncbi:hypothetical protein RND81_09G024200 [Saponaria officinalis]|uniref:Uncharacterized protein n=2 Tax=Saponaria officinalis TaxID=3572 RepID=A0AAW1IHV6_SAPOF